MCLLAQPSLLTVIIVVHNLSISIAVKHPSAKQEWKKGRMDNEREKKYDGVKIREFVLGFL